MKEDGCLNVYIAGNESVMLMNFRMILQRLGYHVAGSMVKGDRALDEVLELKPDLLLLNISIPGMDEITLSNQMSKVYKTVCMFITGYFTEAFMESTEKVGALGYLIRPVDKKQLEASIRVIMTRFEER